MAIGTRVILLAAAGLALTASADAQTGGAAAAPRRVEVAAGGGFMGGGGIHVADANLRGPRSGNFRLFRTESQFAGAPLLEARAAFPLTPRYVVEGRFGFSRMELRSSISDDVEGAPPLTVAERVDRYVIDGALLVMLDRFRFAGVVPFASAGAGYLRQLHEGQTVMEQGAAYHVGGGVRRRFFLRDRGLLRSAGVRGDARLYLFSGGVGVDEGVARHVAGSASLFVTF